jgi:hypothetical protein
MAVEEGLGLCRRKERSANRARIRGEVDIRRWVKGRARGRVKKEERPIRRLEK